MEKIANRRKMNEKTNFFCCYLRKKFKYREKEIERQKFEKVNME